MHSADLPFNLRADLQRLLEEDRKGTSADDLVASDPLPVDSGDPFLVVSIAERPYAIALPAVREIYQAVSVSRVPTAALHIDGIVSVRGVIVPVIDLTVRLGLGAPNKRDRGGRLVVFSLAGGVVAAVRVDQVVGVKSVSRDSIDVALSDAVIRHRECVAGAFMMQDTVVTIISCESLCWGDDAAIS